MAKMGQIQNWTKVWPLTQADWAGFNKWWKSLRILEIEWALFKMFRRISESQVSNVETNSTWKTGLSRSFSKLFHCYKHSRFSRQNCIKNSNHNCGRLMVSSTHSQPTLEGEIRQRDRKIQVLESDNEELREEVHALRLCLVEGKTLYGHAIARL